MVRTSVGSPGSAIRKRANILQDREGFAGEELWAELTGSEIIGQRRFATWHGQPPVDMVDHRHSIGYQTKVLSEPKFDMIAYSGAHREVVGRSLGRNIYFGTPTDKVDRIKKWLKESTPWGELKGWKIVMLYNESGNRVVIYSLPEVSNAGLAGMEVIATFDNDTGEFRVVPGTPDDLLPPGIPHRVRLRTRFPLIPPGLRSSESVAEGGELLAAMGPFRRPEVRVRRYRRRY